MLIYTQDEQRLIRIEARLEKEAFLFFTAKVEEIYFDHTSFVSDEG